MKRKVVFLLCSHYGICCGFSLRNEVEEHGSHSAIATVSLWLYSAWLMIPYVYTHTYPPTALQPLPPLPPSVSAHVNSDGQYPLTRS